MLGLSYSTDRLEPLAMKIFAEVVFYFLSFYIGLKAFFISTCFITDHMMALECKLYPFIL